jgi:hypothetical protein
MNDLPLGRVAWIGAGWQPASDFLDGPLRSVRAVSVGNITDSRIDTDALGTVSVPFDGKLDRYLAQPGDVLVACRGTQPKVAIAPPELLGVLVTSTLIMVRLQGGLLPEVLFAYLRSPRGQSALLALVRSGTRQVALSPRDLSQMPVPVPPMECQHLIAQLVRDAEEQFGAGLEAAKARRDVAHRVAMERLLAPGGGRDAR